MKIALLGNMNNNNFAILRYFRDLGLDAYLLLFHNDGKYNSNHFKPEADTFEIDKWKKYIIQTKISDNIISAFNFPFSWILAIRSAYRKSFYCPPISKNYLIKLFKDFDFFIGSGITPALFSRINYKLDIFYPYAIGVEYLGDLVINELSKKNKALGKFLFEKVKKKQINGLKNTSLVVIAEPAITLNFLIKIGVNPKNMFIPIVYKDNSYNDYKDELIYKFEKKISESNFSIISHVRNKWKKPYEISPKNWIGQDKNNDRIIIAFARFLKKKKNSNPLLILFEYGEDVIFTKRLICKLKIEKHIFWLPKSPRKIIMKIISMVDIGIGEFYDIHNMFIGGSALEILSLGKPLIQSFNYSNNDFKKLYGIPPPPILHAKSSNDIYNQISKISSSLTYKHKIGEASKKWFDTYYGTELAKQWSYMINQLQNRKKL